MSVDFDGQFLDRRTIQTNLSIHERSENVIVFDSNGGAREAQPIEATNSLEGRVGIEAKDVAVVVPTGNQCDGRTQTRNWRFFGFEIVKESDSFSTT